MEKVIEITKTTPGYKHTIFEGTCSKDVTTKDIEKRIYHPMFGGREARVFNGNWRAICHND